MSVTHSTAPFWQDPGNIAINRRNSHVPLHSFKSVAAATKHLSKPPWRNQDASTAAGAAAAGAGRCSPRDSRRQELSGCEWGCKVFPNPKAVPEDFWEVKCDDTAFTRVGAAVNPKLWLRQPPGGRGGHTSCSS